MEHGVNADTRGDTTGIHGSMTAVAATARQFAAAPRCQHGHARLVAAADYRRLSHSIYISLFII